ncbi:hypothetical protein LLUL007_03800 [Lactococcus cremoris]
MLWYKYFKSKIPQIGFFLLMSAIYIVTFWLWHLPMMAFFNSTLFALIIFVIYLISSYFRWKAMREAVERVMKDNQALQKNWTNKILPNGRWKILLESGRIR